jgi:preprotein translocase subunit SecD
MRPVRRIIIRLIVILAVVAAGVATLSRSHAACLADRARSGADVRCAPIRLGLDLQGGIHMVLELESPAGLSAEARSEAIERAVAVVRNRIDHLGVQEPVVQRSGDRVVVELPGVRDPERAREVVGRTAFLELYLVRGDDEFRALADRLGRADPELASRLLNGGGAGRLLVRERNVAAVRDALDRDETRRRLPPGVSLRWGRESLAMGGDLYRPLWILEDGAFLTGEEIEGARPGRDEMTGETVVAFDLSRAGGRVFERVTAGNVGRSIAIVLDDAVVSAPVIEERIAGSGRIRMAGASFEDARDLAVMLRAGALPAPLRIMEQRSIGPSLGAESVAQGLRAGLVGLGLVALAMIAYYRVAGVMAVAALAVYVVLVMAGMVAIDRALTLPGIAGLILSIGMAVDANVLVFERAREEARAGSPPRRAVDAGFRHAMSAIVDSNITTLLTALVLYHLGTGPVRGFAVTLGIGIVASFFSAVFVTRTFLELQNSTTAERQKDRTAAGARGTGHAHG